MRLVLLLLAAMMSLPALAHAASRQFNITTSNGQVAVDGFETDSGDLHPAVVILSGSRGFGAPAYDDIGRTFRAAGLDVYLVHVLTPGDVKAIATAGSVRARVSYYARRLPVWTSEVRSVLSYFEIQRHRTGMIGLLGISLGAEIAADASVDNKTINALILVDGGFPDGFARPIHFLPPLHLIWCAEDPVFPLSVAETLSQKAVQVGGSSSLGVYKSCRHDFFLRSEQRNAAYQDAIRFLVSRLSQKS